MPFLLYRETAIEKTFSDQRFKFDQSISSASSDFLKLMIPEVVFDLNIVELNCGY